MTLEIAFSLFITFARLHEPMLVQNQGKGPTVEHQFDNPERDATLAIAAGDLSIRGVNRFTTVIPGISGDYPMLATKYKIRVIENTSDYFAANDPNSYDNLAARYAFTYNRYVFERLGCNYKAPLDKCTNYP